MILSLLRKHYLSVILGSISVILLINSAIVTNQRDAARAQRDEARTQVAYLSTKVEEQNNAVLALEAAAAHNREVYLAGLDAANRRAVRLEIKAEDILRLPEPAPEQLCEATEGLLREGLQ